MRDHDPIRVLFVCLGNICRSPLAEALFRHHAEARGVADRFEIDSAGTSAYHQGAPPDERSSATARSRGVLLTGKSRQIAPADLRHYHYVLVMDAENLHAVQRLARDSPSTARVHRLREWDTEADSLDVPDPYYGGSGGFDHVHDVVDRSCKALLDSLLANEPAS